MHLKHQGWEIKTVQLRLIYYRLKHHYSSFSRERGGSWTWYYPKYNPEGTKKSWEQSVQSI